MASSSIVIKVKFGETLRRFNALIQNQKLTLDVVSLKAKIRNLFNFDSNVDFTLTYVDEDGDEVTLADDEDINDVVQQSLNPLRITVKLNNPKTDDSNGTATPLKSPQAQLPEVSRILKSVPEPFRDALANLPIDVALAKATSSSPVIDEIVEKLKRTYFSEPAAQIGKNPESSNANNGEKGKNSESSGMKDPEVGKSCLKKKEENVQKANGSVKFKDVQSSSDVDLNIPYYEYESFPDPLKSNKGNYFKSVSDVSSKKMKDSCSGLGGEKKKDGGLESYLRNYLQDQKITNDNGGSPLKSANDYGGSSSWTQDMMSGTNQCPFSGMQLQNDLSLHSYHPSRGPHHWKRSHSHGSGSGIASIFHRGVRCDGCGVHPITGPRFKSKVKEDYDLCSVCFAAMGNVADYMRLDRPTNLRHHHMSPFKGFHDPSLRVPPPSLPHALRAPGSKLPRSKLDSRFILDVNILDGTIVAPFTAFTKIWRMRNNGTMIWPQGSQLHWIGGDRLSNSLSVEVEIPGDGLPVEQELDVAVDFTAPELPGRYISYWRMASPSGQKFGQRVWVLIQVDTSMKDLGETSINLNLPPVVRSHEVVDLNETQNPLMDNNGNNVNLHDNNFIGVEDSEETILDWQKPKDTNKNNQEMNFPINDTLIIGNNDGKSSSESSKKSTDSSSSLPAMSSLLYPTVEVDAARSPNPFSSGFYPTVGAETPSVEPVAYSGMGLTEVGPTNQASGSVVGEEVKKDDDRELGLLMELEDMGFKQVDLNREILKKNDYDLEKSVDDLCGVSEWDPMLEELQEMGFEDAEANRRLLKKNNGSIKGVVMDLINGESG